MRAHYNEMGLDVDQMFEYVKWENQIKRYSEKKLPTDYKIPFISHAVWVTNPEKPREIMDRVEPAILDPFLDSYRILDATGVKWTHYLWTNH